MGQRPLIYFWLAFYGDDEVFPQFDPSTGEENLFGELEMDRITKFGIYPFTGTLSALLNKEGIRAIPTRHPHYVVHLDKGDHLIYLRRNAIQLDSDHRVINREIIYVLGKKRRVGRGWNRFILFVKETGDVTVSSDFNYGIPRWSE